MHTFQELLRAVTQEFATRYYIAILLRFLKILPLQPGHMGDRCSPHARDAQRAAPPGDGSGKGKNAKGQGGEDGYPRRFAAAPAWTSGRAELE